MFEHAKVIGNEKLSPQLQAKTELDCLRLQKLGYVPMDFVEYQPNQLKFSWYELDSGMAVCHIISNHYIFMQIIAYANKDIQSVYMRKNNADSFISIGRSYFFKLLKDYATWFNGETNNGQ